MRTSRLAPLSLVAALALTLTACATPAAPNTQNAADGSAAIGANPASADAFPVTIEHVYGTTTITEKPERIATVAWANHEVPLALGVVPVGMSKATWGDDDGDGVLPWVEDKLDELGADTPVLFDETDGIPFDDIAATAPDVILASYSGLSEDDYKTLSKIAPVVAYPDIAWGTTYQQMIEMNAEAMGLADEGDQLIADLEKTAKDALAAEPALADASIMFSYLDLTDLSKISFYTTHDTRPSFLADLGVAQPAIIEEKSRDTTDFFVEVSAEEAELFSDVDVFVTYGDDTTIATLQADPLLSKIPAIAAGRVAVLPNATPLAASANPSPLSIGWGISDYFAILADAAAK